MQRGGSCLRRAGVTGAAQLVLSVGATCNVLASDTSYEERKQNHGAAMDIWRLDFSVHNGSGRWPDHLVARYEIESEWPECTNWDAPGAGALSQSVEWANSNGHIQESGRNGVAPGRILTATRLFIVLRGDPQPRFSNRSMDFDCAAAPPPPAVPPPEPDRPRAPEPICNSYSNDKWFDCWYEMASPFAALYNENPEVVRLLVAAGADPNAGDRYGQTPLYLAMSWKSNYEPPAAVTEALIDAGADPNRGIGGTTPLDLAGTAANKRVLAARGIGRGTLPGCGLAARSGHRRGRGRGDPSGDRPPAARTGTGTPDRERTTAAGGSRQETGKNRVVEQTDIA